MATNIQMNIKNSSGTYDTLYPQTSAGQIAEGTLADARIPSLAASKITSGTFDTARIPTLPASQISAGTFQGTTSTEYIFPGHLRIGGTGSSSAAKLRIGDSDYVYLYEDTDDNLTIKAKRIEFTTTSSPGITNNGTAITAPSYPITVANGGTGGITASAAMYNLIRWDW